MMSSVGCEHRSVKVAAPVYPLPLRPRESASRARAAAAGARPRPGSRGRGAPACWAVAVACGRAAAARPVRRSRARRRTASACQLGRAGLLERKPTANFCASLPMALQHKKLGYGLTLPLAGVKRNTTDAPVLENHAWLNAARRLTTRLLLLRPQKDPVATRPPRYSVSLRRREARAGPRSRKVPREPTLEG